MDNMLIAIAIVLALSLPVIIIYLLFSHIGLKKQVRGLRKQVRGFHTQLDEFQQQGRAGVPTATDGQSESEAIPTPERAVPLVSEPVDETTARAPGPWELAKQQGANGDGSGETPAKPISEITADNVDNIAAKTPKSFVFKGENLDKVRSWLMQNWFLAVAALSLALAGVFLVQYGVENGLLSPFWRVMGAAFFGVALILSGEFIRRRSGDHSTSHTAYLPSTFAGAGLVALFAAVLAARQMYGLIGAETALIYLVMVSGVAVALGWYYGPFLAVVGILGSTVAPFLVGGDNNAPDLLYYYFALIAGVALLVDAIKRWAWVSALALIFTFAGATLIYMAQSSGEHYLAFGLLVAAAAIALPRLSIRPSHIGATTSVGVLSKLGAFGKDAIAQGWPEFPTRIAAGAFVGAGAVTSLVVLEGGGLAEVWLAIVSLSILFVMTAVWCKGAPALADLAALPALLFLGIIVQQSMDYGSLHSQFALAVSRAPEVGPPWTVSWLIGIGLIGSAIAHWRGLFGSTKMNYWSAGAAILAPLTLITLEFMWDPAPVLGAGRWAIHAIIIAAVMVLFAGHVARRDGEDKRRVAYYALAAMTMISFALVIILSSAALTVALAVMVLGAALIDRRLNLPLLGLFVQLGTVVIGWRLVLDPGLDWGQSAPLWEVMLAYLGSISLLGAAWFALDARGRATSRLTVESGVWAGLGVLICLLLWRAMGDDVESHWGVSLLASVWLMLMLVQLYRLQAGGWMRWIRDGLAIIYGVLAFGGYLTVYGLFNPLEPMAVSRDPVVGPLVFDSLLVAFGLPALIMAVGLWKLPHIRGWRRSGMLAIGGLFAVSYVGFEIRRFWRGRDLSVSAFTDAELYSYTVAMLLGTVGLLFMAFYRRSLGLRRLATIGIALTIAKVFLIDMAGLTGMLRVVSFLGLGLSLAGLGWIYRRMAAQWEQGSGE